MPTCEPVVGVETSEEKNAPPSDAVEVDVGGSEE
jgi:hypothetical protein